MKTIVVFLLLLCSVGSLKAGDTLSLKLPSGRSALFEQGRQGATLPLLVVFHGGGQSGQSIRNMSKIGSQSLSERFHILYPHAVSSNWNDGRTQFQSTAYPNDVAFIDSLIKQVKQTFPNADTTAIYLCGISSGGLFSFYYAQQRPHNIKGIAVVAAAMLKERSAQIAPSGIPLMILNGTLDPIIPYNGGNIANQKVTVLSAKRTAAYWMGTQEMAELPSPQSDTIPVSDEGITLLKETWNINTNTVVLLTFTGAGHTWPGGPQFASVANVGPVCRGFNASLAILEFFQY